MLLYSHHNTERNEQTATKEGSNRVDSMRQCTISNHISLNILLSLIEFDMMRFCQNLLHLASVITFLDLHRVSSGNAILVVVDGISII